MMTKNWVAPDGRDLYATLEAGQGPVAVLDPCGELWAQFWLSNRGEEWRAWRLMPGLDGIHDSWDILGELQDVNVSEGAAVVASGLFPLMPQAALTPSLMRCVLTFADDCGQFCGLPGLATALWAEDLWTFIARWSRQFPYNPSLKSARELLTHEGAGEAALAIRLRMMTFAHPHVTRTFQAGPGFNLRRLRRQPGQILFLTPDIRCLEDPELKALYTFMTQCLLQLSALHSQPFTLFQPVPVQTGEAS
ncbi:prepilin peptidase-dependent protein [Rahnella sp. BCC 1045]|uniref:prepilin peptidase-dependent protein n=1 Tax=Rahnella sp. BCC 1045 TaxID=2816251 RepID=UPI001C2641A4|nr:prepilin peptidase-dependent protein [Rahnella sp. BCC 1045]MBU9819656.1 prepilin peptidase-dependent protein [Rahnella sp. BCC 1045]